MTTPLKRFETKDSGRRDEFGSGCRRDTQDGKPRYELVPVRPLTRLAELYARGAVKYGEHNWQKGMPFMRVFASLLRHAYQWLAGDRTEDHLAAVAWNAFSLMAYEEWVEAGLLAKEMDDRPPP